MEDSNACFAEVIDQRQGNVRHNLQEILVIALCTMLCGGEDCSDRKDCGPENIAPCAVSPSTRPSLTAQKPP